MAGTRKARVPMSEQIRLINECRKSSMTDADWYRENDIATNTFYNWGSHCACWTHIRRYFIDTVPKGEAV